MTIQSNIIEKYWEYDQKYEEDEIIRYISYSTECSLDYNRESKTIDIYIIFSYYEDMYEEESSNKYTKVLEIAFENFMSENTMFYWSIRYEGYDVCPGGNDLVGFFGISCTIERLDRSNKLFFEIN